MCIDSHQSIVANVYKYLKLSNGHHTKHRSLLHCYIDRYPFSIKLQNERKQFCRKVKCNPFKLNNCRSRHIIIHRIQCTLYTFNLLFKIGLNLCTNFYSFLSWSSLEFFFFFIFFLSMTYTERSQTFIYSFMFSNQNPTTFTTKTINHQYQICV